MRLGAVGSIGRQALDENRLRDPVAGTGVGSQLLQPVPVTRVVPQVVMRIADDLIGIEGILGPEGQPGSAFGVHRALDYATAELGHTGLAPHDAEGRGFMGGVADIDPYDQ